MTAVLQDVVADLRRRVAELEQKLESGLAERDEAIAQQAATAEVLQVINSSPGDLAPVFDAIVEKAVRLCCAAHGFLRTYDGECFPLVTERGEPRFFEAAQRQGPIRPRPGDTFDAVVKGAPV